MSDPRILIEKDKRLPDSLSGDANKAVVVNATEDAYIHSSSLSAVDITGQIILWPLDVPPSGYLICDGAQYNVNDYSALGQLLGGVPGGQFNVPDLSERFPKGSGGSLTNTQENEEVGPHNHIADPIPDHTHGLNINSVLAHYHTVQSSLTTRQVHPGTGAVVPSPPSTNPTSEAGAHSHTGSNDSAGGHTLTINANTGTKNQPACTRLNFCIKT